MNADAEKQDRPWDDFPRKMTRDEWVAFIKASLKEWEEKERAKR